jgi:hypothetical protein
VSGERWTFWRYVWLKTGEVTRSWVIDEPPPAEAGPDGDGFELQVVEVMPVEDHQDALGEAQLEAGDLRVELHAAEFSRVKAEDALGGATRDRDRAREACIDVEAVATRRYEEVQALEEKLETLRSGLKAEVSGLESEAETTGIRARWRAAERLRLLLDASEDTEKQSDPVTQLTPKQRETISTVQGHLEGYADVIEAFGVDGNAGEEKLWRALREDAEKLRQSGGGEDS